AGVAGAVHHEVDRLGEDLAAYPRRGRGPRLLGGDGQVEGARAVGGGGVGDLGKELAGRGIFDGEGRAGEGLGERAAQPHQGGHCAAPTRTPAVARTASARTSRPSTSRSSEITSGGSRRMTLP